jgi:uncharacterized FlaG/YvyC family protein
LGRVVSVFESIQPKNLCMDIKNIAKNILPFPIREPERTEKAKTEQAGDREGNGQSPGDEQKSRRQLSETEMSEALEALKSLSGIKENGLTVRLAEADGVKVVYIEDPQGKIVRRIPESELGFVLDQKDRKSGNLFNKAM